MSYQKDREIFNIGGFRGLDTENPKDKVASFRATNGKNFQIDSNALKTRPGLINDKVYNVDGNIIGMFVWNGLEILLTVGDINGKSRIYIINDNFSYYTDGLDSNVRENIFTNISNFSFDFTQPFFVQEKKCLFIFCVNDILVLSAINNNAFVVYSIDDKIPYDTASLSDYCTIEVYNDLPYAYVPTIQIGENFFEDVNLLSNKRKYKLFNKVSDDLYNEYYLLGDYDPVKNGELSESDVNVEFYGKNINSIEKIPNFLGVQNELPINYETRTDIFHLFDFTTKQIKDGYTATEIWEFLDTDTNFENPISQVAGITKAKALKFIISNDSNEDITIFEYLQNIDLSSYSTAIGEKQVVFKFPIDIEAMYRIKNSSGAIVSSANKKIFTMYIYFGYYEIEQYRKWILLNSNYVVRPTVTSTSDSFPTSFELRLPSFEPNSIDVDTFANLPVEANVQEDTAYYCEDENHTLYLWSSTEQEFVQVCIEYPDIVVRPFGEPYLTTEQKKSYINWFHTNYTLPSDILEAQIRIKTRNIRTVYPLRTYNSDFTLPQPLDEEDFLYGRSYAVSGIYNNWQSFSDSPYPSIRVPVGSNPVIVVEAIYSSDSIPTRLKDGGWYAGISQATFSAIKEYINNEHLTPGNYNLILHIGEIKTSGFVFQTGYKYSFGTTITVNADADYEIYLYNLHILHLYRQSDTVNNLFELSYTEEGLKAKVINYLINYKNEPAITITIGFAKNSYNKNLIAKTKFGTTFGSESRVFLAGNPDFKHIDRYNVSNDLLGNNDVSQSYELSYFPSKNYRVVGSGASEINGYAVATDTMLYITKTFAVNDSCLYIRSRTIGENGNVSFFEYRTNITKTPINNKCIVNFYNDIVMLTKDGLLGIEIASNVLTNERLLKLRSGFINKQLKEDIANNASIFCIEDNERLYMVVGKNVYVADARYVAINENAQIDNVSYEIVKWELDIPLYSAINTYDGIIFYDAKRLYSFEEASYDKTEYVFKEGEIAIDGEDVVVSATIFDSIQDNDTLDITSSDDIYVKVIDGLDLEIEEVAGGVNLTITVDNINYIETISGSKIDELIISAYNAFDGGVLGTIFNTLVIDDVYENKVIFYDGATSSDIKGLAIKLDNRHLYLQKTDTVGHITLKLRPFIVEEDKTLEETELNNPNISLLISDATKTNCSLTISSPVEVEWISGILDFGNKLYEKTMFSLSFYVKTDENSNLFQYGYRTLRGHKALSDLQEIERGNSLTFYNTDFNVFSLTTFENSVISKRQKENNFLYIQFIFSGKGNIEISDFLVYYKNNRKNK